MVFYKNFLYLELDTIEKHHIINLSSYSSKSYTSVALSDFEVKFLEKGKDSTFIPFFNYILFI